MCEAPAPLFTLRGHEVGVTALARFEDENKPYLLSGDEGGTVIIWDLTIYRACDTLKQLYKDRIQSLKVAKLVKDEEIRNILFVQTRENGIKLLDLSQILRAKLRTNPIPIISYSTYNSSFSRSDVICVASGKQAILAHQSLLENDSVTIRFINQDGSTSLSGTAKRCGETLKNCSVFDILLKQDPAREGYIVGVAYEDGHLCLFRFAEDSTKTVPHLESTGLEVELIKDFDLAIRDFISSFDLFINYPQLVIACGSPLNNLIFVESAFDSKAYKLSPVTLKRQGISTVRIRPDLRIVAVACWDNSIKLYSMKTRKLLANLKHHLKQVQDMLFIEHHGDMSEQNPGEEKKYLLCCASLEGTISITSIY